MEVTKVTNATRVFKIGEVETKALRGVNLSIVITPANHISAVLAKCLR